ncbi:RNA polymerase sigma factor [compost metagenome]
MDPSSREFVEDRDAERVLLAKERVSGYLKALEDLGSRTRDIYLLFRLEGMRQKEIAALFGISASTVEKEVMKATLHLARRSGMKPDEA